ncbi:MAG: hypothetical protein C0507_07535 [Cyanobacteria bacterium PR.3.49]|nr:hypothetical protein [Cyanobacteria bacterium PR.3.49]
MSTCWDDLVSIALIGTDQQKMPELKPGGQLGILLDKINATASSKSKESIILSSAGCMSLHQKAGTIPDRLNSKKPEPCGAEDWLSCEEVGHSRLKILIEEHERTILPLWLNACAAKKRRLPERAIPLFLDLAKEKKEFRPLVCPVIGNVGRWLAAMNSDWSFAAISNNVESSVEHLEESFETGPADERVRALEELRRANPERALTKLQETWDSETISQKVSFLDVIAKNCTIEDEPFLEEISLIDKRKEVRERTTFILSKLLESRFAQRMLARALELIKLEGKRINMSFPKDSDKEMVRDGIVKAAQPETIEDKIFRLVQIVKVVPPSVWSTQFRMSPEQILEKIEFDDIQKRSLIRAWASAAGLHSDKDWLLALSNSKYGAFIRDKFEEFYEPGMHEEIVLSMMRDNGGKLLTSDVDYQQPILNALLRCNHEWSEPFARKVMPQMLESIKTSKSGHAHWVFKTMGAYFPVSLANEIETECKKLNSDFREVIDPFLTILTFKCEVFAALNN